MDFKVIALLILIGSFMGMTVAQASCDPETQYEKGGQCCRKCEPGTSMSSATEDCATPQCHPCPDNHYQDKYTKENKCLLQPYCDRNKNFEDPFPKSKTQKSICKCKVGFHCSSKDCITCVVHTVCQPGYGAKVIGNESQDTECEKCPEGTFNNNNTSWDAQCRKWTECETGYHVEEKGTHTTDNTCGLPRRGHIIVISVISVMAVITVVILVLLYRGCIKKRAKGYFKPLHPEEKPTCTETILNMPLTPEENEDDPSHELSSEGFTEKGNQVMQERGKEEIVSRQESQLESQFESQEDSQSMDPFYKPVQACTSAVES